MYVAQNSESGDYKQFLNIIGSNGLNLVDLLRFKAVPTSSTDYSVRVGGNLAAEAVGVGYDGLHLKANMQGEPAIDEPNLAKDPSQFIPEADDLAESILRNRGSRRFINRADALEALFDEDAASIAIDLGE